MPTEARPRALQPSERLADLLLAGMSKVGLGSPDAYTGYQRAKAAADVLSWLPGVGAPQMGADAGHMIGGGIAQGSPGKIAGGLGMAALGALPGPVGKGVKKVAGKIAEALPEAKSALFDLSRLDELPKTPQTDLPRYEPPRGVSGRVADLTANPDVRDKMIEYLRSGQQLGGAKWYNTDPLRDRFIAELGDERGAAAHARYMDYVAATSPRSDVPTNVRNASYYATLDRQGLAMPEIGVKNPQPYGHMAQKLHQRNAQAVQGAGWDALQNPKPASFAQNLTGNYQPVTVDTHAMRLPAMLAQDPRFLETGYKAGADSAPVNIQKLVEKGKMSMGEALQTPAYWQSMPRDNEYGAFENYYKGLGRDVGMAPAQTQASAWVGGAPVTGLASDESKAFMNFFEDRVHKTAAAKGMEPLDVLTQFIRGKQPLLAVPLAAGVGAGFYGSQQPDQPQQY